MQRKSLLHLGQNVITFRTLLHLGLHKSKKVIFATLDMRLNDSTEVCLLFPFDDWQIDNGFFNRPTIAGTPILVHRWGPRIRISALFRFFCEAGYRPREIDILSLIYLKCPEYYGILCNSGTVHAVIPRAVVLFCSSGRASRGQRKSYIRDGAGVSREPGSRVLL